MKGAEQREITNEGQQSPDDASGNDRTLITPLTTDPGPNLGFLPHLFHAWSLGFRHLSYFPPQPHFFYLLQESPPSTPPSTDVPFCSFAPVPRDKTKLSQAVTDSDVIASRQALQPYFPTQNRLCGTDGNPSLTHGNIQHHLNLCRV